MLIVLSIAGLVMAAASLALAASPVEHEVAVRFDPAGGAIEVEQRFAASGQDIDIDLAPWMELVATRFGGRELDRDPGGDRIRIPEPGPSDALIALTLRGVLPGLTDAGGRLQAAGTSPAGSYLFGSAGWMARGPAGGRIRLTIEVPAAYRAVATGRLESEALDSETYQAAFLFEGVADPPAIFVGPYVVEERQMDGLRLRTYFHPEQSALAEDYLQASGAYLRRYGELIGPYPYAGFAVVAAPLPVGLGFEGLTYVSRRILPLPFMRGRSLAHEVLHNWWGNGVGVDYARGNWAEGLTTYMADYALAEEDGAASAREMRLEWLRNLTALPSDQDMAVARFVSKTHDRSQVVGYDKTALIFHMLRREIGEVAFGAGLRSFWQAQRFKTAAWADLQGAFEAAAGRELGWFFEQWLTREGLPRIALEGVTLQESDLGFALTLTLSQAPQHYRLRLPLVIETGGESERRTLTLDSAEETFRIALDQKPRALHIDPVFDVARKLLPGESPPILRDVTLSDKTVVVVASQDAGVKEAADELARRLLQRQATVLPAGAFAPEKRPVLMIGLSQDVAALRAGILSDPAVGLAGDGTARSWTETGPGGAPWLFVSADSLAYLQELLRPLPHYKNRSFVIFDKGKVLRKGLWPTASSPLSHRFD